MCTVTVANVKTNELLTQLIATYDGMKRNGDDKNARKVRDLYQKYYNQQQSISFVGHFSAGKSSFINAILQENILPASPIPTSANIVQITSGRGNVKVFFSDKKPEEYSEPYDIDMIKDYCTKKGTISRIEISTSQPSIPDKWAFFDTPGIDAADDADRLITESSLHLVDMFVYIMDYNHVQSEANMQFLEHIQSVGIPFLIVINQIDKHNEGEIPFSQFQKIVKQTFDQWEVYPQNVFYTSMTQADMAHNEFKEAKQALFDLMSTWDDNLKTIERSFTQVTHEHNAYLQTEYERELADIGSSANVDVDSLEIVEENLEQLHKWPKSVYETFQYALQTSLKNAYIMPADLRDKAALFLEAQQDDFKVGIISSKKKTAKEKQKRTEDFLTDLNTSIQATIQWKIRDKFQTLLTENNIPDSNLVDKANNISLSYTKEDLVRQQNPGAKVNGNYVLRYTDEVSSDIKQQFKKKVYPFLDHVYETMNNRIKNDIKECQQEKEQIESALKQKRLQEELTVLYTEKQQQINEAMEASEITSEQQAFIEMEETATNEIPMQADNVETTLEGASLQNEEMEIQEHTESLSVHHTVQSLEKTMEIIKDLPGFQSYIKELTRKQTKLQERSVTIALFGAFSAGKSSFANALLGENVLPSSPQPTTAVINRILPVSDDKQHGTVHIQYKDENALLCDIRDIVSAYKPQANTLDEIITWMADNHIQDTPDLSDVYRSYLHAILTGYRHAQSFLGKKVCLSLSELDDYLTVESVSCYLEIVDVYYQCAFTDQGITLVDTPGADSVNRRHTNVAFNYIKHADAIFYVTYYNHALSHADKAFLTQLGRVKDAFQLDKMFFIINAIDLAHNSADLKLVERYVQEQLMGLGIRFPSLFPLSSKQALISKLEEKVLPEEMYHFEDTFYNFIHHDLPAMSIGSAFHDMKRVYQAVQTYLENVELNEDERVVKQTALYNDQAALHHVIKKQDTAVMEKQLMQKVEKQLYYVEERIGIQFHDMFKEAYNPTSITESGKAGQTQLKKSLHHLLDDVRFELVQEMQAVSLRVEAYIETLLHAFYKEISHHTESISTVFSLPQLEKTEFKTPRFEHGFVELDVNMFRNVFSMYKGTRAFFAKNEKEAFKDALYTVLKPVIHEYITTQETVLNNAYQLQLNHAVKAIKTDVAQEIEQHVTNHLAMLSDTMDKEEIINKRKELEAIVS